MNVLYMGQGTLRTYSIEDKNCRKDVRKANWLLSPVEKNHGVPSQSDMVESVKIIYTLLNNKSFARTKKLILVKVVSCR